MENNKVGDFSFCSLEEEILSTFKDGQLISHEWMKSKFGIIPLCWDDYKDVQKLFQAKDKQQFDYMTLVDKLRWDMLKRTKCYLKNIYGDGYVIVPKEEQAEYGFTQTMKEIKESLRKGALIIGNVRPLPMFAVSSYNDIKSRFSTIKSVLSALKLQSRNLLSVWLQLLYRTQSLLHVNVEDFLLIEVNITKKLSFYLHI